MSRLYDALKRSEQERERQVSDGNARANVNGHQLALPPLNTNLEQSDENKVTAAVLGAGEQMPQAEPPEQSRNKQKLPRALGLERNSVQAVSAVTNLPNPKTHETSDFDLFALLRILRRRKLWILTCSATVFLATVLVCVFTTPQYIATARLQLLNQELGRLSLKDAGEGGLGWDFYSTLQSYVTVMQSDTIGLQVINDLDLSNAPEFRYDPPIKNDQVRREMAKPVDEAPLKRAAVLRVFRANLGIEIVPGTRLIMVSYRSADPRLAAKIVNQLVSDFLEHNFQVRYNATTKATEFLTRQLLDLKTEVERSEGRAGELQKASGIIGQYEDEHDNIITTKLNQLNDNLTAAEANRVMKEAVYNLSREGNPELIASLVPNGGPGKSSDSANSLQLINHLRQQEADLKVEYADAASKYGAAYPRLIEIKNRLSAVEASIQTELGKILDTARDQYELAVSQEAAARKMFVGQKAVAVTMNDRAIDYTIAKHEAESNRLLYDNLLQKVKEAQVLAGLRSSELNVVDPATVPGRPAKPRVRLYLVVGAFCGLLLGIIAAFAAEAADRTMRNPDQIEIETQLPVLGIIPEAKALADFKSTNWLRAYAPDETGVGHAVVLPESNVLTEAFRWVRTSLLLSRRNERHQVVLIASATQKEGKSFASLNLAAALAQSGNRVLLVDGDLRRSSLTHMLKQSGHGLSEVLLGGQECETPRHIGEVPGLFFMPAGATRVSPTELLASQNMDVLLQSWRREFTYIVIDSPALLPVSDAAILSSRADAVIMVARFGFTQSESITRAMRILRNLQVRCIGVLVNAVASSSPEYSRYCGHGNYNYGNPNPAVSPSLVAREGQGV